MGKCLECSNCCGTGTLLGEDQWLGSCADKKLVLGFFLVMINVLLLGLCIVCTLMGLLD
jgi:hypothetical protein